MNHAGHAHSRSTGGLRLTQVALLVTGCLLVLPTALLATPVDHSAAERATYSTDALGYETPAEDLLLTRAHERKAEALAYYMQGLLHEEQGDSKGMLTAFRCSLDLEPANVDLAEKVAFELVRRGAVPEGVDVLKDAAKAVPDDARPFLYLAGIYARDLGKRSKALAYARTARRLDDDNPAVYRLMYELLVASGQPRAAKKMLDEAAELKTEDTDFWLWLAEFQTRLLVQPNGTTAKADLKKLFAIYQKVQSVASGDVEILVAVADFYVYVREIKRAIPLYLKVLKSEGMVSSELLSNVREKLARTLLLVGERQEAVRLLEKMVRTNPLHREAYELLGHLYEESGDFSRALSNYQQCLLLNPNQPIHSLRVADMQLRLGQSAKAAEVLRDAHNRFPHVIQISYSLAIAYTQAEKYQEALTSFEAAYQDAVKSRPEFLTAGFFFNYGIGAERAGLFTKAVGLFERSIKMDPKNAGPALNYLGYMWADRGENLAEAERLIQQALALEPGSGAYIDSLGWLYYQQGQYDKALVELLHAEELLEKADPVVYDHIAEVYKAMGVMDKALVYWQKAAALAPENQRFADKMDAAKQQLTLGGQPQ